MAARYTLYGWPLSYYSGKARAYLRHKGLPFVERPMRLWHFSTLKKKVGAVVMPVVVTPEGEWLQDTADIIAALDARHPQAPALPATPRQRIAGLLIEAWGDEFWVPSAMHYRWSFPENYAQLFRPEAGDHLLPLAPRFLKDRFAARSAALMRSYLPGLGVVPAQLAQIERWTTAMCDALNAHFARHPFVLGERPCVADFGLIGPLFAHLGRDPYPARTLIAPRPHLQRWIAAVQSPAAPARGELLPGDEVPSTLEPVLRSVFGEFWPYLQAVQAQVDAAAPVAGRALRRSLGMVTTPLAGEPFTRAAAPFPLWKLQRVLDADAALADDERARVHAWAAPLGGEALLAHRVRPRLVRRALRVLPA